MAASSLTAPLTIHVDKRMREHIRTSSKMPGSTRTARMQATKLCYSQIVKGIWYMRLSSVQAKLLALTPEFARDDQPHSWLHREVNHYPVSEATTLRFRQHREDMLQGGGVWKRYGRARTYITCAAIDTPYITCATIDIP